MDVFYETGGMMDTSKEYIEMCKKATEIQEVFQANFKLLAPSFVYCFSTETVSQFIWLPKVIQDRLELDGEFMSISIEQNNDKYIFNNVPGVQYIFIPRQGQLQAMVSRESQKDFWYAMLEGVFPAWTDKIFRSDTASYEQLWLAFVMKEKYNKTWDGTDWVKGEVRHEQDKMA